MAKFKLSLLTAAAEAATNSFIATTITDYIGQSTQYKNRASTEIQAYQTQATYAEKLSLKQNSQKELTFSMLRNVFIQQDWTTNPYVNLLHVGSLLELQDKYGHTSLFVINKIAFNFKTNNIEYQYTCQDAFSYQHTRQQSGYTINNDASDEDYIGPKSIDWWVIRKIVPECRIQYEYIPLEIGVYKSVTGSFEKFNQTEQIQWDDSAQRTIIKSPVTSVVDGVDEFQETFAFSCSNATAASVLISLGDNLGLMPHAEEYRVENDDGTISYRRFFWFEPQENAEVTGIKYSPDHDISKFDLNFSGSSLTTVLNVDSNTVGDELVTLFPNTPGFFTQMFMDADQWNENAPFVPGFFSSANRQQFYYSPTTITSDDTNVVLNLDASFYVKTRYEYFQFIWDENTYSRLVLAFDEGIATTYTSLNITFGLRFSSGGVSVDVWEGEKLPSSVTQKNWNISLIVAKPSGVVNVTLFSSDIHLTFYHLFTDEEREFAKVADTCPWLENKLIDFSYFLQQGILTRSEYSSLISKFNNDLRLINGRLMYYTDEYYRALKQQTSILSNMQNEIDSIGAQIEADIISPVEKGKKTNNLVELQKAYHTLFNPAQSTSAILNRDELVAQYFEKYLNAEQKFLKNVYAFRQYFNAAVSMNGYAVMNQYKLKAPITDYTKPFLGLSRIPYSGWETTTSSKQYAQKLTDGRFKFFDVVTDEVIANYPEQYGVSTDDADALVPMSSLNNYSYNYNSNCRYYLKQTDFEDYFGTEQSPEQIIRILDDPYYQLTTDQICNLILRKKPNQYYIRDTTKYVPLDYVRLDPQVVFRYITWMSLPKLTDYWLNSETDWSSITFGNILWDGYAGFEKGTDGQYLYGTDAVNTEAFLLSYYKAYLPVTQVYYYGSKIIKTTSEGGKTTYAQVDEKGNESTSTDYKEYQPMSFMSGGYTLIDAGPRSNSSTQLLCQQLTTSFPYQATAAAFYNDQRLSAWSIELNERNTEEDHTYPWVTSSTGISEQEMFRCNVMDSYYANFVTSLTDLSTCVELMCQYYSGNKSSTPDFDITAKRGRKAVATWYQESPKADMDSIEFKLSAETAKTTTQYYNYYKYIVPTFDYQRRRRISSIPADVPTDIEKFYDSEPNNLYVKNKYLRILTASDIVNLDDTYVRIPIWGDTQQSSLEWPSTSDKIKSRLTTYIYMHRLEEEPTEENLTDNLFKNRFSSILWYPLNQQLQTITWTGWEGADTKTLKEALVLQDQQKNENTTFDSTDSRIFKTTTKSSFAKYIYCHVENYERGVLTTEEGKYGGSDKYTIQISTTDKDLSLVFDAHTDQAIHTLQIPKALESYKDQLYLTSSSTLSTAQVTADDLSKTWIPIYKKTGDDVWTQVYTSNQLKQAAAAAAGTGTYPVVLDAATFETIYDINSTTGELIMYNETAEPITTTIEVFACSLTENKDSTYSLSVVSLGQKQIILGQNNQFEYNNKTYSGLIAIDGTATTTNLTALTNGQFWHNYHQDSANAYLFEQAAVIETQLQTYWDQAYTASKYCKYFLPESWQPYDDQTTNTFTKDILVVDEQNRVSLSAKYLPAVEIYTDAANESTLSMFVNKHYLPKYDWELVSAVSQTSTLNSTYNENVLAEHEESNYINPAVTPLIVNNRAIQDVMSHLGSSLDKWRVIKNGYMTYYYAVGGGMLWKDVPQYLASSASLECLDGQYGMFYYLLSHNYAERETPSYNELKQQQLNFWQNIHDQYPYLVLESNYSCSLATTSEELLKMAQLVFKGLKKPEQAYSLTVIDMANLNGYKGQELTPGQGILLDASKYYNANDDVYRALSQYLFISDVSYNLRNDVSISITVNSIKYQEKLLQSLVKLIR